MSYRVCANATSTLLLFLPSRLRSSGPPPYAYALLVVGSVSLLACFPYLFGYGVSLEPLSAALFAVLVALALQALRLLGWHVRGAAWASASAVGLALWAVALQGIAWRGYDILVRG